MSTNKEAGRICATKQECNAMFSYHAIYVYSARCTRIIVVNPLKGTQIRSAHTCMPCNGFSQRVMKEPLSILPLFHIRSCQIKCKSVPGNLKLCPREQKRDTHLSPPSEGGKKNKNKMCMFHIRRSETRERARA